MDVLDIADIQPFFVFGNPMIRKNNLERFRERGATPVWMLLQPLLPKQLIGLVSSLTKYREKAMNPEANTPSVDVKELPKQEPFSTSGQSRMTALIYDIGAFFAKALIVYYFLVAMLFPEVGRTMTSGAKAEIYNWTKLSLETRGAAYVLLLVPNNPVLSAQVAVYFEKRGEMTAALAAWEAAAQNAEEAEKSLTREGIQQNIDRLKTVGGRKLESSN